MKTCPQCDTGYPDSQTACPIHGHLLNEIRELKPGMVIHKTYRIVRKLGQGGMGTVYLAQHIHMDEPRALKFLSPELSRDQALTGRFLREVRTLRQIRNRNVVDCGDLEAAEDDSLFFSMEFVDGPDLRSLMHDTTGPFPVPLSLSITRQIAEGLGAAHAKDMVHRDIKPENILMARDGDSWLPKIADFGIVATKESSTAYTRTGGTLLTMAYAAPEQWRGTKAADLDGRTDLYALGGLLYEMLTGQTPFQAENYEGWAEQHRNTPPQPPSTLRPDLANWHGLDALVLRLLAKDREQRPKDVAEVLRLLDMVRYGQKRSRRTTIEEHQRTLIDEMRVEEHANIAPIEAIKLRTLLGHTGDVLSVAFSPDGSTLASGSEDRTIRLWDLAGEQGSRDLTGHKREVCSVAFSPDGSFLASASRDKTVRIWDVASGQELYPLRGHTESVCSVAFSADGQSLTSASYDDTINVWDVASGGLLRTVTGNTGIVYSVAIRPDGRTSASASGDHNITLQNLANGRVLSILKGHSDIAYALAFSPNGRTLASGSDDRSIKLWDVSSGQVLHTLKGHTKEVNSVAFSPDGRTMASGSADKSIKLWDAASGQLLRTLQGHSIYISSVAFSPDGRILASGSGDKTIKLWDVTDLKK